MSRNRTRGRRYENEPKLNLKKVAGVIVALAVIIMIITSIINIVKNSNKKVEVKIYSYYTAYQNGKFGVINNDGEIVIEPSYDEIIAIPNNSKPIFICTYDVDDENGTYKTKAINNKNEEILTEYEKIEAIDNYDSKQNIWYEDNVLRVSKNGKYGLIDLEGKEVLTCDYDEITALKSIENNIIVKKAGNVGLVNEKGQTIIPVQYKNILTLKEGYKNEYIIVNENNQYGLIRTSGEILIEPKYEGVKYLNSSTMFAVKEKGVWKLLNTENASFVIEGGYEDIKEAKNDSIVIVKDGKYGVINTNKKEKIAPQYEELKYAFSIYYIAKKDDKYGIINLENQEIIPFEYISMVYVEEAGFIQADKTETETVIFDNNLGQKISGIISEINIEKGYIKVYVNNEYKYYNFKFEEKNVTDLLAEKTLFLSKKDGKYGYVNKSGEVVIDYNYEDATEQNSCGFSAVKKDGVWGSINKVGAIAKEPSVNLDNSIYIDFIGEWYLSDNGLYYQK
ncbi:MAG: WG repeat-containing protein [Clostridia bacterium]|nr:WG repeat-containing protein [Clostridia bacterium]